MYTLIFAAIYVQRKKRRAQASKRSALSFSNQAYSKEEDENLSIGDMQYSNMLYDWTGYSYPKNEKRDICDSEQ